MSAADGCYPLLLGCGGHGQDRRRADEPRQSPRSKIDHEPTMPCRPPRRPSLPGTELQRACNASVHLHPAHKIQHVDSLRRRHRLLILAEGIGHLLKREPELIGVDELGYQGDISGR
jgi:hypothetical protein